MDDDKVVHVVFNPSKQTEADKIELTPEALDKLWTDILMTDAELDAIIAEELSFSKKELKTLVEDFLTLGHDEFTAYKLARQIIDQ